MPKIKLRGKFPLDEVTSFPVSNDPGGTNRVPYLDAEEDGNIRMFPVVTIDPLTGKVVLANGLWNPGTGLSELPRTPTVYKNVTTLAAGSTAIWTAAVGKRWRLMGVQVAILQGTTAAAGSVLKLLDVAADTGIGVTLCVGAMTAAPDTVIVYNVNLGNGILAAATNTALNVNLSTVLGVAGVSVQVWGTEE